VVVLPQSIELVAFTLHMYSSDYITSGLKNLFSRLI